MSAGCFGAGVDLLDNCGVAGRRDRRGVDIAAIDFGSSSVRVASVEITRQYVRSHTIARFPNVPLRIDGGEVWDFPALAWCVIDTLRDSGRRFDAVGVDSWSSDYVILRDRDEIVPPQHQRQRAAAAMPLGMRETKRFEIFRATGAQLRPYSTFAQLIDDVHLGRVSGRDRILLIPDYVNWLLGGEAVAEQTNASTTVLLGGASWSADLLAQVPIALQAMPRVVAPGTVIGQVQFSGSSSAVVASASHDTAAAVAALPSLRDDVAFVSCGTWLLTGVETDVPVRTRVAFELGLTNEAGVGGRNRLISVAHGLWMVDSCLNAWGYRLGSQACDALLDAVRDAEPSEWVFDPIDIEVATRVVEAARLTDAPPKRLRHLRRIFDSLASHVGRAIDRLGEASGKQLRVVHLLGGGSQLRALASLIADASGLPVVCGPVEATALGNGLVQAQALGAIPPGLEAIRDLVIASTALVRVEPTTSSDPAPRLVTLGEVEESARSLGIGHQRCDDA